MTKSELNNFLSAFAFSRIRDGVGINGDERTLLRRFFYGSVLSRGFEPAAAKLTSMAITILTEIMGKRRTIEQTEISLFSDTLQLIEVMEKGATLIDLVKAEEKTVAIF